MTDCTALERFVFLRAGSVNDRLEINRSKVLGCDAEIKENKKSEDGIEECVQEKKCSTLKKTSNIM